MPIDDGPAFFALLKEWICGDIDMKAMRDGYLDLPSLQTARQRGRRARRTGKPEPPEM
jgi:hypothetical protein